MNGWTVDTDHWERTSPECLNFARLFRDWSHLLWYATSCKAHNGKKNAPRQYSSFSVFIKKKKPRSSTPYPFYKWLNVDLIVRLKKWPVKRKLSRKHFAIKNTIRQVSKTLLWNYLLVISQTFSKIKYIDLGEKSHSINDETCMSL